MPEETETSEKRKFNARFLLLDGRVWSGVVEAETREKARTIARKVMNAEMGTNYKSIVNPLISMPEALPPIDHWAEMAGGRPDAG